jgi:DnaJ-class molecular chaperone
MPITLLEAYNGSKRTFELDGQKLRITIKPGAYDGQRLRLKGKGRPGGRSLPYFEGAARCPFPTGRR